MKLSKISYFRSKIKVYSKKEIFTKNQNSGHLSVILKFLPDTEFNIKFQTVWQP